MAKLSAVQLDCIEHLATGKNKRQASISVGVNPSTLTRWLKSDDFNAELNRRIRQHEEVRDEVVETATQEYHQSAVNDIYEELRAYRNTLMQTYKARLQRGLKLVQKTGSRFDDLPEEAIAPKDIATLMGLGDQMIEKAMKQWAEVLALDELLGRLGE